MLKILPMKQLREKILTELLIMTTSATSKQTIQ